LKNASHTDSNDEVKKRKSAEDGEIEWDGHRLEKRPTAKSFKKTDLTKHDSKNSSSRNEKTRQSDNKKYSDDRNHSNSSRPHKSPPSILSQKMSMAPEILTKGKHFETRSDQYFSTSRTQSQPPKPAQSKSNRREANSFCERHSKKRRSPSHERSHSNQKHFRRE
jgi:hypothetical protein